MDEIVMAIDTGFTTFFEHGLMPFYVVEPFALDLVTDLALRPVVFDHLRSYPLRKDLAQILPLRCITDAV